MTRTQHKQTLEALGKRRFSFVNQDALKLKLEQFEGEKSPSSSAREQRLERYRKNRERMSARSKTRES